MNRGEIVDNLLSNYQDILNDSGELYVLMLDLCDSTNYKQRSRINKNPDLVWVTRQLIFLRSSAKIIESFDGRVVKTVGDSVMGIFKSDMMAENVLKCAIETVQLFQSMEIFKEVEHKIIAKASMDYGATYNGTILPNTNYDPIGTCVDRCARLESVANNNELVFSVEFKNLLDEQLGAVVSSQKYGYYEEEQDFNGFGQTKYYTLDVS